MKLLKKVSAWMSNRSNWKVLILATLLFFSFIFFILPETAERSKEAVGSGESPDSSYIYSSTDLYRLAEAYGEEGRAYYIRSRFTFDVIWPLVYFFFLVTSLSVTFKKCSKNNLLRMVNLLPLGGLVFDYLENVFASITMARFPSQSPVIAEMTPVFTFIKWNFIYVSFTALVIGIVWILLRIILRQFK
ncbi:hypothetical protein [Bacillus horti]|uniref:Uncharacterized protein n=1 Tax=Caldalkalibacillus horti TaxID=77523 RepID=A0ABT9W1A3_9BACI|nr:hypothetical protein [Bacillus horti]MDQ0167009.1 hypothetical protein [Bacillus horti]